MALVHAYCSLEDLKMVVGNISDSADDPLLERAINAASRQIDGYCNQRFWLDDEAVAREFYVTAYGELDLRQGTVVGIGDVEDLEVNVDTAGTGIYGTELTDGTDFLLHPRGALVDEPASPYTSIRFGLGMTTALGLSLSGRPTVEVTARWGWPEVPAEVVQACLLQAAQLWKAKDAVFGVAAFGEFGPLRVRAGMNPIAEDLVSPYRILTVA